MKKSGSEARARLSRKRKKTPRREAEVSRSAGDNQPLVAKQRRVAAAFRRLLVSLGEPLEGELLHTPARAAELWTKHLLSGTRVRIADIFAHATRTRSQTPVSLLNIGVHLVCPHHLTVAFGEAHLAYIPGGRVAGFGALARLVSACAARLALQENVTAAIADGLVAGLGARGAVAVIEATHPCHNVLHPRSHRAHAITWAASGERAATAELRGALTVALTAAGRATKG